MDEYLRKAMPFPEALSVEDYAPQLISTELEEEQCTNGKCCFGVQRASLLCGCPLYGIVLKAWADPRGRYENPYKLCFVCLMDEFNETWARNSLQPHSVDSKTFLRFFGVKINLPGELKWTCTLMYNMKLQMHHCMPHHLPFFDPFCVSVVPNTDGFRLDISEMLMPSDLPLYKYYNVPPIQSTRSEIARKVRNAQVRAGMITGSNKTSILHNMRVLKMLGVVNKEEDDDVVLIDSDAEEDDASEEDVPNPAVSGASSSQSTSDGAVPPARKMKKTTGKRWLEYDDERVRHDSQMWERILNTDLNPKGAAAMRRATREEDARFAFHATLADLKIANNHSALANMVAHMRHTPLSDVPPWCTARMFASLFANQMQLVCEDDAACVQAFCAYWVEKKQPPLKTVFPDFCPRCFSMFDTYTTDFLLEHSHLLIQVMRIHMCCVFARREDALGHYARIHALAYHNVCCYFSPGVAVSGKNSFAVHQWAKIHPWYMAWTDACVPDERFLCCFSKQVIETFVNRNLAHTKHVYEGNGPETVFIHFLHKILFKTKRTVEIFKALYVACSRRVEFLRWYRAVLCLHLFGLYQHTPVDETWSQQMNIVDMSIHAKRIFDNNGLVYDFETGSVVAKKNKPRTKRKDALLSFLVRAHASPNAVATRADKITCIKDIKADSSDYLCVPWTVHATQAYLLWVVRNTPFLERVLEDLFEESQMIPLPAVLQKTTMGTQSVAYSWEVFQRRVLDQITEGRALYTSSKIHIHRRDDDEDMEKKEPDALRTYSTTQLHLDVMFARMSLDHREAVSILALHFGQLYKKTVHLHMTILYNFVRREYNTDTIAYALRVLFQRLSDAEMQTLEIRSVYAAQSFVHGHHFSVLPFLKDLIDPSVVPVLEEAEELISSTPTCLLSDTVVWPRDSTIPVNSLKILVVFFALLKLRMTEKTFWSLSCMTGTRQIRSMNANANLDPEDFPPELFTMFLACMFCKKNAIKHTIAPSNLPYTLCASVMESHRRRLGPSVEKRLEDLYPLCDSLRIPVFPAEYETCKKSMVQHLLNLGNTAMDGGGTKRCRVPIQSILECEDARIRYTPVTAHSFPCAGSRLTLFPPPEGRKSERCAVLQPDKIPEHLEAYQRATAKAKSPCIYTTDLERPTDMALATIERDASALLQRLIFGECSSGKLLAYNTVGVAIVFDGKAYILCTKCSSVAEYSLINVIGVDPYCCICARRKYENV